MAITDRLNKAEISGFLVQEDLITTGDLVSDNLGTGGLLTIGEKGIDGYSPVVTLEEIITSEGREGYVINITDADHPVSGQSFTIMNGAGISNIVLNDDFSLTIYLDDGTEYTTDSIRGETGNGIDRIVKTSTVGNVDTYTIYFTDGNTTTYEVTNGLASTDYNILTNKPSINNVELVGDLSLNDLNIQEKLTSENAGDGISITTTSDGKTIISNTNVSAEWGNIQGNITDQTDLVNYIEENGGKIDSISVNGVEQPIDSSKNVDIKIKQDFGIYGIPFGENNLLDVSNFPAHHYKYTLPEYIITDPSGRPVNVSHFLSGEEIRNIILENNAYVLVIRFGLLHNFDCFARYCYWTDTDTLEEGTPIPILPRVNLGVVFNSPEYKHRIMLTEENNILTEAIGYLTSNAYNLTRINCGTSTTVV